MKNSLSSNFMKDKKSEHPEVNKPATNITVMIIDDERNARQEIRRLLADYSGFEIIAEAANAAEAVIQIRQLQPDLLFLDIQMPEKTGFELLAELDEVPEVIFFTAYDQYAVKAFEISALDYLMKPVRTERFNKAIEQAREKLFKKAPPKRIFVKDRNQYHFISWDKVFLIESMDNYARLFFEDQQVLFKSSLNELEKKSGSLLFIRINRAQIVNLNYITKVSTLLNGRLKLTLHNEQVLEVSGRQTVKFKKLIRSAF